MISISKKLLLCTFILCCYTVNVCRSEELNSAIMQNSISIAAQGCDTYAWTDEYLFIAHGYCYNEPGTFHPYWFAPYYSLTRVDIRTGEPRTLIQKINAQLLNLFIDGHYLYSVWQSFDAPYTEYYGYCQLVVMDYDANVLRDYSFYIDDIPGDYLLDNQYLYMVGKYGIYKVDI